MVSFRYVWEMFYILMKNLSLISFMYSVCFEVCYLFKTYLRVCISDIFGFLSYPQVHQSLKILHLSITKANSSEIWGSHYGLPGCDAVHTCWWVPAFLRKILQLWRLRQHVSPKHWYPRRRPSSINPNIFTYIFIQILRTKFVEWLKSLALFTFKLQTADDRDLQQRTYTLLLCGSVI
jgi:hypothetical protein